MIFGCNTLNDMDDEADELVEVVVVAAGTGLSWDIPVEGEKEEWILGAHSVLEEGDLHCGESVLSSEGFLGNW